MRSYKILKKTSSQEISRIYNRTMYTKRVLTRLNKAADIISPAKYPDAHNEINGSMYLLW